MHDQISDSEGKRKSSKIEIADHSRLPLDEPGRRSTNGLIVPRPISHGKQQVGRIWLREVIGWGGFLIVLGVFFAIQNYLNGVLSGAANQIAMVMSVFLEIGLIWFWDRIWY